MGLSSIIAVSALKLNICPHETSRIISALGEQHILRLFSGQFPKLYVCVHLVFMAVLRVAFLPATHPGIRQRGLVGWHGL